MLVTSEGHAQLAFDDVEVFDAMEDFLTEECDDLAGPTLLPSSKKSCRACSRAAAR